MTVFVQDQPENDPNLPLYADVLLPALQLAIGNGEKYLEIVLSIDVLPVPTVTWLSSFGISVATCPTDGSYLYTLTWSMIIGELPFGGYWLVDEETRMK